MNKSTKEIFRWNNIKANARRSKRRENINIHTSEEGLKYFENAMLQHWHTIETGLPNIEEQTNNKINKMNFREYLIEKYGISILSNSTKNKNAISKIITNSIIIPFGNRNSHNYPLNESFIVKKNNFAFGLTGSELSSISGLKIGGNNIFFTDFEVNEGGTLTSLKRKENDIINEIDERNKELSIIKDKIHFCETKGVEEFKESEYKIFKIMEVFDKKDVKEKDRERILSELIK